MPLYKPSSNPAALAQSAMSGATQAAASQTKQTTVNVEKESDFWDDLYKGTMALGAVGRGLSGIVNAAEDAWNMYDKYKLRDAYDNIDKTFGEGGFEAIQNNPDMQDYWHSQALGQFVKDRANNEKGRLEMLKNMDASSDKMYQDWRTQAMSTREAFDSGNMQQFMPLMQQLAANSPLPYRLQPDERGNFKVMFRSDQHGGWADTGRTMTPQEAMGEVNNVLRGEQMVLRGVDMKLFPANEAFISSARRAYWGTVIGNAENRLDPKKQIPLYDATGKLSGLGVLQSPVNDYNAVQKLVVFGRDGRQIGVFDGYDGAMRAGLSPFKPEKAKGGDGAAKVGAGGYKLTNADVNILTKYATSTNAETGEKEIDYGKAAFLQEFIQKTGLSPLSAIENYESNIQLAMSQGARSREQAERAAMVGLRQKIHGGGQVAHGKKPVSAPASQPGMAPGHQPGVHNAKEDRIKNAAAGAKPGTLDSLGSSSPEFDSYGNTINGLTNAGRAVGNWLTNTGDYADPEDVLDYRP